MASAVPNCGRCGSSDVRVGIVCDPCRAMKGRDIRLLSDRFIDDRPIVRLGDVGAWSMVRHADYTSAAPFVISRRTWDRCPALHGAAENAKGGRERKPNEA
jgi:hypothetical protein